MPLGFATPLVRSFVAIPAGILEIGFRRFILSAAAGIALFCAVLAGIGWAVGSSWSSVHHDFVYVDALVVLAVVVFAAVIVIRSAPVDYDDRQCRFHTLTSRRSTRL